MLLRHLDALLLYAKDEAWLPELIEYVPYYAPRLDALGPHLGLLAPHITLTRTRTRTRTLTLTLTLTLALALTLPK